MPRLELSDLELRLVRSILKEKLKQWEFRLESVDEDSDEAVELANDSTMLDGVIGRIDDGRAQA